MKTTLSLLLATILLGCSGSSGGAEGTTGAARDDSSSTPSDSAPAPCPSSAASPAPTGSAAPSGLVKTPSPTDMCEGAYDCAGFHNQVTNWLHSDGVKCYFGDGTGTVLFPDGHATDSSYGAGTWKGDVTSFSMEFAHGGGVCTRSVMK